MSLAQILKRVGFIMMLLAVALLLPLFCLFAYPDNSVYVKDFVIPAAISGIIGVVLFFFINAPSKNSFNSLKSSTLVVLLWIVSIVVGSLPFIFSGQLSVRMAIFESTSGWTTTGLTVMDVSKVPNIFLMWRSITQFLGGLGVVFFLTLVSKGGNGMVLFSAEGHSDRLHPNVKKTITLTLKLYGGFLVLGTVLYTVFGMTFFDALNHTMTAISTAGFTTKSDSIGYFNSLPIEIISIVLMWIGSVGFAVHALFVKGRLRRVLKVTEIRVYIFVLVLLIIVASLFTNFREAVFNITSVISTTGFSTVDYKSWGAGSNATIMIIMLVAMHIGGCSGSTAGGIKQFRVAIAGKSAFWEFKRRFLPERLVKTNYITRPDGKFFVKDRMLAEVHNYIVVYLFIWFLASFVLSLNGYSLRDSFFEVASAMSTAGASVGVVGQDMSVSTSITIIICMLIGRLEFVVLFTGIINTIKDSTSFVAGKFKKKI